MSNNILKNVAVSCTVGYFLFTLEKNLESDFISDFFLDNLISLLVTILTINIATLGIVLTKIKDLLVARNLTSDVFKNTKSQMLLSIKEQIVLIILSGLLLIAYKSQIEFLSLDIVKEIIEILLIACFTYAILILYDTAKSVFSILDF